MSSLPEQFARRLFDQAIREERCGELLSCLFDGGSATVDDSGLVLASAEDLMALAVDPDIRENEILATGAISACLKGLGSPESVSLVVADSLATNELWVSFDFLKSRYRLTVTMDPEDG